MTKIKVNRNNEETEIEVLQQGDHLRVTKDGQTADLQILYADDATVLLEYERPDGTRQSIRAAAYMDGDKRQVWVNGRFFTYERVRQRAASDSGAGDGFLSASIPAVVSELLVKVGDAVSAGDKLILLESMKMIIPIQAPYNGTVTAVNCATGDSVQAGIPLIELEKMEDQKIED